MEKDMRMFISEHQVVPDISRDLIRKMHFASGKGVEVLYSFSNLEEKRMYAVIKSPDRLSIEAFMSELRIPCDSIMEVEVFVEGKGEMEGWKEAA